jgi:ABC-type transporter Mla subunit MlaD
MRLVITPSDVLAAARALAAAASGLAAAVSALTELTPRLHDTVDRAGRLLEDLERRRPQVDELVAEFAAAVPPLATTAPSIPALVDDAAAVAAALRAAADDPRARDLVTLLVQLGAPNTVRRLATAGQLLDHSDELRDALTSAREALRRLDSDLAARRGDHVGQLIDRLDVDAVVLRSATAGQLLDRTDVDAVVARTITAGDVVEALADLLAPERRHRLGDLVDRITELTADEQLIDGVRTLVQRALVVLTPERTERLAALLDHSERLISGLEDGRLPSSEDLKQVPPDLRAALELLDELHQVVTGMPGARRAQERGADPHPRL